MLSRDSHQQLITTPIGWKDSRREWERSTNSQDTEESGCSKKESSVWGEWIIAFKGLVLCIFSNDWIKPSIRCYFSWWIKNTVPFSRYRITTSLQEKQVKQKKVQLTYQLSHWLRPCQCKYICTNLACMLYVFVHNVCPACISRTERRYSNFEKYCPALSSIQSLEKISPH